MQDPMTVAFDIVRPWPRRTASQHAGRRWRLGYRRGKGGPWVLSRFWTLAGREWYWPALITVWHHDPSGHDSTTCNLSTSNWRWHIHHWRIQVHPVQHLRRWALTRCAWCGGKSRKDSRVNCRLGWGGPQVRWWQPERGLYHRECTVAHRAWGTCTCAHPDLGHHDPGKNGARLPRDHGDCARCGRIRPWRLTPDQAARAEDIRARVTYGTRP